MAQSYDLATLRHSAAHLLAQAVTQLFPNTLLTIGPATKDGFFYDFLPEQSFKEQDLERISARMKELVAQKLSITHEQISKDKARQLYHNNPFKLELIDEIPGDTVGLAHQGDFYDLCKGGHVASTADLANFKLLNISGSYWRGDRAKPALQRISGTAFATAAELQDFERKLEEAEKYDHRRLGKQLDLFSFHEEGVGFPFFHPHGKRIINQLIAYMRKKQEEADYQEIATPILLNDSLWKQSGHYQHYKDNMYFCNVDNQSYAVRPMNCPGSILVYRQRPRSYRELPLRLAEFGLVHRHELSGALHGLMRVRAFTIDDAHIYCMPSQIEQEVARLIVMIKDILQVFNFNNITVALSTRPKDSMGDDLLWERAITDLSDALKKTNTPFQIHEGDGAFYGPKIEFVIHDSMDRAWTCSTIQLDFCQPENFDLSYISPNGTKERPVIIHHAIYGSLERFFAILLEHYKGNLPFWLAPVQIEVMTITDAQQEYARGIAQALTQVGLRVELNVSADQISAKIKAAQEARIPWMLVLGNKEQSANTIALRQRDGTQQFGLTLAEVIKKAQDLVQTKK